MLKQYLKIMTGITLGSFGLSVFLRDWEDNVEEETANSTTPDNTTQNTKRERERERKNFGVYGLHDPGNGQFYRYPLDLQRASSLLSRRGMFWEALQEDIVEMNEERRKGIEERDLEEGGEGEREGEREEEEITTEFLLQEIKKKRTEWMKSWKMVERKEVTEELIDLMTSQQGKVGLMLGGKSIGKSLLLRNLQRQTKNKESPLFGRDIILVNGRKGSDLGPLMVQALPRALVDGVVKSVQKESFSLTDMFVRLSSRYSRVFLAQQLKGHSADAIRLMVSTYSESNKDKLPVIVIDEANIIVGDSLGDDAKRRNLRELFDLFVLLSKELHKAIFILASSEHTFPFYLSRNFSNITNFIFMGEVSPKQMFELLCYEWGMGPRLADMFLNCYGGNVWLCSIALDEFSKRKGLFIPAASLPAASQSHALTCTESEFPQMENVLREVAEFGFAPVVGMFDERIKFCSEKNVLGFVMARSTIPAVPYEIREKHQYGVVPSSQYMRLLLAQELVKKKEKKNLLVGQDDINE